MCRHKSNLEFWQPIDLLSPQAAYSQPYQWIMRALSTGRKGYLPSKRATISWPASQFGRSINISVAPDYAIWK